MDGAGVGDSSPATGDADAPSPTEVLINPATRFQKIDGFGAADTWAAPLSAAQQTAFFDPVNGIGLSILRIGIDTNGTPLGAGAYPDAIAAHKFGAIVWGAPWSPPAADKSNDNVADGGELDAGAYQSWATTLANFADTFKQNTGFSLYGISAQNEPDFSASYPSCVFQPDEMVAFIKVLGPLLAAKNVKLIAPEAHSWALLWGTGSQGYGSAILADSTAAAAVDIVAVHDYGHKKDSDPTRPAPPASMTQPLWQTEMSDQTAPDTDIAHGVQAAVWIYAAITAGGASAWHYWWLINQNTDGEGLLASGGDLTNPPKRFYTMGNYSKFVRPGYYRVDVGGLILPSTAWISAFVNPSDSTLVVVAINSSTSAVTLPITIMGSSAPAQMTPYVTSASDNLAAKTPASVVSGGFQVTLGAQSVTTYVGKP
jgi:glucuronoarabinoxylan endo-1,4-beta-xylanase